MHEAAKRLRKLITDYPLEPLELLIGAVLIGWGIIVMHPADSFSGIAAYSAFKETSIGETAWGFIALFCGGTLVSGTVLLRRRLQLLGIVLCGLFYVFITSAIVVSSSIANTGISTYGMLAVASALSYLRRS